MSQYKAQPITKPTANYSAVYRNSYSPNKLISTIDPLLTTFSDFDAKYFANFKDEYCFGRRNSVDGTLLDHYDYLTYAEVNGRKDDFASGLIYSIISNPKYTQTSSKPDFIVSMFSENRIEWMITDLATRNYSLPNTALYDTLGPDSSNYILELTKSPVAVVSKSKILKILELKRKYGLPNLIQLISMDSLNFENDYHYFKICDNLGLTLLDFNHIEKLGSLNQLPPDYNLPTPETIYTISFTSGTTGNPKGVVVSHEMAVAGFASCFIHFKNPGGHSDLSYKGNIDVHGRQIRVMSYLPLAHIYERMLISWATYSGFAVGFTSKPGTESLFDDLKILKPNYFTGVPRIYSRIENEIKSHISLLNPWLQKKFYESIKLKKETHFNGKDDSHTYWLINNLIGLNKIKESLGFENVSYLTSASAPISKNSIEFLKSSLHVGFENSYGLTESFAVMSSDDPFGVDPGNVGPVNVATEMKLKSVEAMGYSCSDKPFPRGELLLRGPQIFKEYYKNPKATADSFDDVESGWFKTGDIATIDSNGKLIIIDRVKNFFKLSQGEYITPEKVENTYLTKNRILTQLYVHGDSLKNYLVGICGIDPESLRAFLKDSFEADHIDSMEELVNFLQDPKVKKHILIEINKNVLDSLQGFEKLHNLHFDIEPLKVADDVLTPTFKLKRVQAKKKFQDILNKLYEEGSLIRSPKL